MHVLFKSSFPILLLVVFSIPASVAAEGIDLNFLEAELSLENDLEFAIQLLEQQEKKETDKEKKEREKKIACEYLYTVATEKMNEYLECRKKRSRQPNVCLKIGQEATTLTKAYKNLDCPKRNKRR
jgi:hypothetical protein